MEQPFLLRSFPRAIIHVDADSFFASCEQAVNPKLKGRPVITGKERGIASAVSIEAKRLGVRRGMSIRDIRKICPGIIYLPSDYETYSLFSKRMFEIVRRYTSAVEEYSIDECFAEVTGLRRPLGMSYEEIALSIKRALESELGITFSLGLAPSKVVAKIASKRNKPSGFVKISGRELHIFLAGVPIGDVWGIGEHTEKYLRNFGIENALDFAGKSEEWVKAKVTKPHFEIWNELRGNSVLPVETAERHDYKSISKTKTFTPPSSDRAFVLSQLSKNAENACIKARRHNLAAKKIFFILRTQDYRHFGREIGLSRPTAIPSEAVSLIDKYLDTVFSGGEKYRSTGVVLAALEENASGQGDLFGESVKAEKLSRIYQSIDELDRRYGKHTVFIGSSYSAIKGSQYRGARAESARRKTNLFKGENKRKRLNLPMLGEVN